VRDSHGGVLTDLGLMKNWEALVDDRRQELVLWMCNNLAELTGAAIYKLHRRWRPIRRKCAGGRREELSHCGVLPWNSPDLGGWLSLVNLHGAKQRGKLPNVWHNRGKQRQPRWWPCSHVAGQVSTATGRPQCPKLIHGEDLFTAERNPLIRGRNHGGQRESRRGVTGGEVHCICWSFLVLYHGDHHESI
jgi:hypothetical protein